MNIYSCLPVKLREAVKQLEGINELRLRVNQPVSAVVKGSCCYVSCKGLTHDLSSSFFASQTDIDNLVFNACQQSVYAYEEQIRNGYIALENGVRLGLCGEVTIADNRIRGYKKIGSVNIRFANHIGGCSKEVLPHVTSPLKNMLVISPPFCGKTTFLRDMALQVSQEFPLNILIADERAEITMGGTFAINGCDTMLSCDKQTAILQGIRSMSPQLIITDEVFAFDAQSIFLASQSGVKFFASIHAESFPQAEEKLGKKLTSLFERFVVLSSRKGIGTLEGVFNGKGERLK